MKRLIYTLTSKEYRHISSITGPRFVEYAFKCNADILFVNASPGDSWDRKSKGEFLIKNKYKEDIDQKYSKVLYIDSDIFIMEDAPDIFEASSLDFSGTLCCSHRYKESIRESTKNILPDLDVDRIINAGMFVSTPAVIKDISQKIRDMWTLYDGKINDEVCLSEILRVNNISLTVLDQKFNKPYLVSDENDYFIHCLGSKEKTETRITEVFKKYGQHTIH